MATALEGCQRPHDARGADVESLERRRRLPRVPLLGRPERLGVVGGVGVGDDALDLATHPAFVPGAIGQRVERLGPVEHGERLEAAAPRVAHGPSRPRAPAPRSCPRAARTRAALRCDAATARASSQSASHGFRGSNGPWRYVPMALPTRQPSKPDVPSFPKPATTRPSGNAPSSRIVRPAWFSKPTTVRRSPVSSSHSIEHVADETPVSGHCVQREDAGAGLLAARTVAVVAAEQLIAAADGEHDGATGHRLRERRAACSEIGRDECLLAILAASDVEEVGVGRTSRRPRPISRTSRSMPRRSRSAGSAPRGCRDRRRC